MLIKPQIQSVCVFCSSSDAVAERHFDNARKLGQVIGENGWTLVYGGASVGLMGTLSEAAKKAGAKVVGIIPEYLVARGVDKETCDELIVTKDLATRKQLMAEKSDAFIVLPGSIGTLEEMMEQMALKGLKQHTKPILLLNGCAYWRPLLDLMEQMVALKFLKAEMMALLTIVEDPEDVPVALATYIPPDLPDKWFQPGEAD